jgi:hypothetical protein
MRLQLRKTTGNYIYFLPTGAAVNRIKFVNRDTLGEYIDDDNKLVAWGGRDTWQYAWEPELRGPAAADVGSAAVVATMTTAIMEVMPNSSVLTFAKNPQGDYSSQLEIRNITSEPIVYKVRIRKLYIQ